MTGEFDLRRYGPETPTRMVKREGGSYVRADDAQGLFRKLKETEAELNNLIQENVRSNSERCLDEITIRRNATHKHARMHAVADFPIQVAKMAFELKHILMLIEQSGQPASQSIIDFTDKLEMEIKDRFRQLFGHDMILPHQPQTEGQSE